MRRLRVQLCVATGVMLAVTASCRRDATTANGAPPSVAAASADDRAPAPAGPLPDIKLSDHGYRGASRSFLFDPQVNLCFHETTQYRKSPPYTIGFSNAGLGDSWRVVGLHALEQAAHDHADVIKKLIVTNANHDDSKQIADIQDLVSQGVDLLIVSANTQQALDAAVTRVQKQGIPVVMVDRRIQSDNFVTYVTASDAAMGRMFAQWIVEKLHGNGNVIILGGQVGSSPNDDRVIPAMQVFRQYPGIRILDTVYSDWSPVRGKQVMQAVIAKYGHTINAVLAPHGLQVPGSIEAFIEAGWKPNEIPMHTSADMNGPMKLALKYHFPLLDIDYPPAMMAASLDISLRVLAGAPVPCTYSLPTSLVLSHGDETPSIPHPDLYLEEHVVANGPDDLLVGSGLGPNYNPSTFKVDYPH